MTTLIELLLRQSDIGGGRIAGDQLRAHNGPALERLLDAGFLEERASVEDWPVCQDCDCGADARPILDRGGELSAICPGGRARDLALDEQDLRRFIISERRLSLELLGGDASAVSEPMPGLWYRSGKEGRSLFLTLRRSVGECLQLLHVLRAVSGGSRMTLIAPRLSAQAELQLATPDLTIATITEVVCLDDNGRPTLRISENLTRRVGPAPRLRVSVPDRQVHVNEKPCSVPGHRFDLLMMLIDAWEQQKSVRAEVIFSRFSRRRATELKTELTSDLSAGQPDPVRVRAWIVTELRPTRYRLALLPGQVEIYR